jgi:hypothetical protein
MWPLYPLYRPGKAPRFRVPFYCNLATQTLEPTHRFTLFQHRYYARGTNSNVGHQNWVPSYLGPVYTTVEKSTGHEKKGVSQLWLVENATLDRWVFTLGEENNEAGQETPPTEKPNSKKCRHVGRPCHFIIHEKSSPPLFSSPSVNTHRSRVAFSTNHNWQTPFFSWPVDFSTVV